MRPFTELTAGAVPLHRANIDTDVMIPITRLVDNRPEDLGPYLFEAWRYGADGEPEPDFALNQPKYRGAAILIAGENFACGSSREHAVWALAAFGIRCVIAPSFSDIFRQNCFQNGLLPVALAADTVAGLVTEVEAASDPGMTVDLPNQRIVSPGGAEIAFDFDVERKRALVEGLDDIGLTLELAGEIEAFERLDSTQRPWNYDTIEETP